MACQGRISIRQVEVARDELKRLLDRASRSAKRETAKAAVHYTALIYLTNARDQKLAHLFPGTTRDQRYQWKRRVIDGLWPSASPALRTFLKHAGPCVMVRRASE